MPLVRCADVMVGGLQYRHYRCHANKTKDVGVCRNRHSAPGRHAPADPGHNPRTPARAGRRCVRTQALRAGAIRPVEEDRRRATASTKSHSSGLRIRWRASPTSSREANGRSRSHHAPRPRGVRSAGREAPETAPPARSASRDRYRSTDPVTNRRAPRTQRASRQTGPCRFPRRARVTCTGRTPSVAPRA